MDLLLRFVLVPNELVIKVFKRVFGFNFHSLNEDFSRDFRSDSREQLQITPDGFGRKAPKNTFE